MTKNNNNILNSEITEELISLCLEQYRKLPKGGKPSCNEWTVLAAVIQCKSKNCTKKVVAMGCGTKCIGESKLCSEGLIINDSHAEVMARRGFLRYIYSQLTDCVTGKAESIFHWCNTNGKFQLKSSTTFHFLSTQIPCGDACIKSSPGKNENGEPIAKKVKYDESKTENCIVNSDVTNKVYTGAKLLGSHHVDAMCQSLGVVRTKPGRGERTLSMSCSDKIAKWQIMGIQGALIDSLLDKPIYFDTMTFGNVLEDSNIDSLERAIWLRFEGNLISNHTKYKLHKPIVQLCTIMENDFIQDGNKKPSPTSLVWCCVPSTSKPFETCVNGKRQGITSKHLLDKKASLRICRRHLFEEFMRLLGLEWNGKLLMKELDFPINNIHTITYNHMKKMNRQYQEYWSTVKRDYFKEWQEKPKGYQNFMI